MYPKPSRVSRHPLEDDLSRLERIIDVMWLEIHKVLKRRPTRRKRQPNSTLEKVFGEPVNEIIIQGSPLSPEDILSEAVCSLLSVRPEDVRESWEAVAIGIARNKAKGALRYANKWLSETPNRPELHVISGDQEISPTEDRSEVPLLESIPGSSDTEAEFIANAQQVELIKLAREILTERDKVIFFGLHFEGCDRRSLAEQFDLTPQGVGHIYRTAARKLYDHPRFKRYAQEDSDDQ